MEKPNEEENFHLDLSILKSILGGNLKEEDKFSRIKYMVAKLISNKK